MPKKCKWASAQFGFPLHSPHTVQRGPTRQQIKKLRDGLLAAAEKSGQPPVAAVSILTPENFPDENAEVQCTCMTSNQE